MVALWERAAVLVGSGGGSLSVAVGHGRRGLMVWTYEHAGKGMDDAHAEMHTYIDKYANKYRDNK